MQEINSNLDLLVAIPKEIEEMTDDELKQSLLLVRELRKIKVIKRKKSTLDSVLEELNLDVSDQILKANDRKNRETIGS